MCGAPAVVAVSVAKQQGLTFEVAIDQTTQVQRVGLATDIVCSFLRANGASFFALILEISSGRILESCQIKPLFS